MDDLKHEAKDKAKWGLGSCDGVYDITRRLAPLGLIFEPLGGSDTAPRWQAQRARHWMAETESFAVDCNWREVDGAWNHGWGQGSSVTDLLRSSWRSQ
ncbi:unnamed protein product [Aspergillus oryzae]|uniref:Unnamed protein product n=1 Tax=Aspergillus oryzae var. brunneus TaxID=332754 RepID=A0ABQ6KU32_ASPOZ|nr:unnamed protein product [Aspergillus oryzae]GMF96314.1 unnamed protein product [Aspergillus oryzae]GMG16658.1 unnamed protein product [Aspergillus oryzae]GMG48336.1 unnamed protein product [Aspergillus oryzae var. brunneus]